ncbi:bifunctional diguanylate cyclase/phosphodiesterase [Stappia sp. P2PMeth1]|uniref:putative bifunctional diguanylate cyclase/phosphodiesterase n=1 Tax=Stappia sp. P2PMeth1 TaxID=2003586 RepID=UPI0016449D9E|nr:GGDEF and EAL domain-containing protein [Stappia sp. P2PMeth1]
MTSTSAKPGSNERSSAQAPALDNPAARLMLTNLLPVAIMRLSRTPSRGFQIDYLSESSEALWGLSLPEIGKCPRRLWRRIHPDDLPHLHDRLREAGKGRTEWSATFRIRTEGSEKWVVGRGLPRPDLPGDAWNITVTDITAQIQAYADLQASEARFRALTENIPGAIFRYRLRTDGTHQIFDMTPGCIGIWELPAEVINTDPTPIWNMIHPDDVPPMRASVVDSARSLKPWHYIWRLTTPSGRFKWLEGRGLPHREANGDTVWHSVILDVTEQRRKDEEIRRLAERDELTGLANRTLLRRRLETALRQRLADRAGGALILIDLDHFKDINDTLGHDAGDIFLRATAERLTESAGRDDVVARIGGDEFVVVMPRISDEQAVLDTIARIDARLSQNVHIDGRDLSTTVSMGVALFPRDGDTPNTLLKHADIALFEAKAAGRQTHVFFSRALSAVRERRQSLAEALRGAIVADTLRVAFQPIVEAGSGRHKGFEALARWTLDGQAISPAEFIPLAEETGLAVPLGRLLLTRTLSLARRLADTGIDPGTISVNVSAAQLREPDFAASIAAALRDYGFPPQRLEIEVTETVILGRSSERIALTLRELRGLGTRIALDDFGTGYASLAHLKRIRVDRLKIDQSFVRDIETDADDAVIVRTVISLAKSLGMDVVAEGIETREQLAFLRHYGCDLAQGYLFGRPTTSETDLVSYLSGIGQA